MAELFYGKNLTEPHILPSLEGILVSFTKYWNFVVKLGEEYVWSPKH